MPISLPSFLFNLILLVPVYIDQRQVGLAFCAMPKLHFFPISVSDEVTSFRGFCNSRDTHQT